MVVGSKVDEYYKNGKRRTLSKILDDFREKGKTKSLDSVCYRYDCRGEKQDAVKVLERTRRQNYNTFSVNLLET